MKTILVIDDDESIKSLTQTVLEMEGFSVITANNGNNGIKIIRQHHPDLIICDIRMTEVNGYEVLNTLRNDPNIAATPFVFLTVENRPEDFRKGMNATADDYLGKPFDRNQLISAVKAVFFKQRIRADLQNTVAYVSKEFHIFLSYSHLDTKIMRKIKNDLEKNHLSVWSDENLEPGTPNWEREVVEAMKKANCVVVIFSPASESSEWVGREIAMAEVLGLRIFPIMVAGDNRSAIPIRLISHQWVDIRHNYDVGIEKLANSIRKHLGLSDN